MAQAARRDPGRSVPVHQVCGELDDRAALQGQHHQYNFNRRSSGRAREYRVLHRQERPVEFHPIGGDGTDWTQDSRQQPDAYRDRSVGIAGEGRAMGPQDARPRAPEEAFEPFRSRVAMQRLPSPSDYARAAVFLASDDAEMITGIDLRVDAGAIAQYWAWDPSRRQA